MQGILAIVGVYAVFVFCTSKLGQYIRRAIREELEIEKALSKARKEF